MKRKLFLFVVLAMALSIVSIGMLGCEAEEAIETDEEPAETEEEKVAVEEPVEKGEVEILYVEWEDAKASTFVIKVILEDMGYDVFTTAVSGPLMFSGLAAGDGDLITGSWLPVTHGEFMETYGDEIVRVSTNYYGARLCWAVPAYCEIDSVEDINDYLDEIDGQIVGIDPGSGLMGLSETMIEEYGLDVELIEGSDATMTAALKDAIERNECVVVTGWAPHWKFATWDLKMLEDPKLILGEEEEIVALGRLGLEEDLPEVYQLMVNFEWEDQHIGEIMGMNIEGGDPEDNARIWIDNNQDLVQQWIP